MDSKQHRARAEELLRLSEHSNAEDALVHAVQAQVHAMLSQNQGPQGPAHGDRQGGQGVTTPQSSAAVCEGPKTCLYFVISYGHHELIMHKTERLKNFAVARSIFTAKVSAYYQLVVMSGHWNEGEAELGHWDSRGV